MAMLDRLATRSDTLPIITRLFIKRAGGFSHGVLYRATIRRLIKEYEKNGSVEKLLDQIYSSIIGRVTVRPIQIKEELSQLLRILQEMRPRTLVEIGTANGGTLFLLTRVSSTSAVIVSVDLPSGKFGGGYVPSLVQVYRSFAMAEQNVVPIRADSHDPVTLANIKRRLGEDPIDFLMIDGDHSYRGVRSDFESFSPMVRRGGIIAFHDIVPGLPSHVGGVPKFWKEIRSKYEFREVVKNWGQGGSGIGILFA